MRRTPIKLLQSALSYFDLRVESKSIATDRSLIEHEIEALNAHSIVSLVNAAGVILEVNKLFVETFGYGEEELLGQPITTIYSNSEWANYEAIHTAMNTDICWTGEQRLKHKDGSNVWTRTTSYPLYDTDGNHIKSISIRTDVTNSKLVDSERDMHAALHMFQDGMLMFTTDTLRFTYMNRAAMERWGWSESDYMGKTLAGMIPDFEPRKFLEIAQPLLEGDVSEIVYISDLSADPYEITLQLTHAADGTPRFVSIERNIAGRLALEKAKDEFTATVSHELRSPLTSIKGGLGLVLSGAAGEVPAKARGLLEIAHRNADRLVLIVNDMLDLEKIAAGQMAFTLRPYDVANLFDEAVRANEAYLAQYNIGVRIEGLDQPVTLVCDPDRMLQVLGNLLTNAAKFSSKNSDIRLSVNVDPTEITLSVQDYGMGIPQDAQETIFERFTQARSNDRTRMNGTGLGLSIVKAIIDGHEGRVEMDSTEGVGTTFRVILPRRSEVALSPPALTGVAS